MSIALRPSASSTTVRSRPGLAAGPPIEVRTTIAPSRSQRPSTRCRLITVTLAAVLVASGLAGSANAQPDETAAKRAAQEIADAQDRANRAAAEWSKAGEDLEALQAQAQQLDQERTALESAVAKARTTAEQAAVERFMSSGSTGIPILTGYQQPLDQLSLAELSRVATASSDDAFDQFDVAQRDLERNVDELASARADVEAQQARYEELSRTANDEVEHLKEVETKRLADEQVRLALEAQRREEQRRLAEQQAAEAARRAAEEAARAAEQQRTAELQRAADQQQAEPAAAAKAAVPASADTPQPPAAAGIASDDAPVDEPSAAPVNSGMICPVDGPTAYSDTWGAPRPGGRRHEGVDMISPKGTPLVAVASGDARFWTNGQGALGVSLTADDGTRYYYGHLSAYEGSGGHVNTGQVIGYVGATGATTVNHLHFEVHPGGGAPVNPYPYVRNAGC